MLSWLLLAATVVIAPIALRLWADDEPRADEPETAEPEPAGAGQTNVRLAA